MAPLSSVEEDGETLNGSTFILVLFPPCSLHSNDCRKGVFNSAGWGPVRLLLLWCIWMNMKGRKSVMNHIPTGKDKSITWLKDTSYWVKHLFTPTHKAATLTHVHIGSGWEDSWWFSPGAWDEQTHITNVLSRCSVWRQRGEERLKVLLGNKLWYKARIKLFKSVPCSEWRKNFSIVKPSCTVAASLLKLLLPS